MRETGVPRPTKSYPCRAGYVSSGSYNTGRSKGGNMGGIMSIIMGGIMWGIMGG